MDFDAERRTMVEGQLCNRGITQPRVLDAFLKVPRHEFVPADHQDSSYDDRPLPIGQGQTISQPYMVGLMTQELELTGSERVLEIGTGSGYQTAILAELSKTVYTVERIAGLSESAQSLLKRLGYANISFRVGDGTMGWPEETPFDRILVAAGSPRVPPALSDQLADNGRMVIPVGYDGGQDLLVITREGNTIRERFVCGCVFVRLIGEQGWKS